MRSASVFLLLLLLAGCAGEPFAPGPPTAAASPTLQTVPPTAPPTAAAEVGQVLFGRGLDTATYAVKQPLTSSRVGQEVYAIGHFSRELPTGPIRVLVTLNGKQVSKYDEGSTADLGLTAYWLIVPGDLIGKAGTLKVVMSDFGNAEVASGELAIKP